MRVQAAAWGFVLAFVWICACAPVGPRQLPAKEAERLRRIDALVDRCANERAEVAVEACREAVRLGLVETGRAFPDSPPFYETLGQALVLERRYQEALAVYRDGAFRFPSTARLHYRLGRLLVDRFDAYEEAFGPFSEAVRWDPTSKEARTGLGDVQVRLNRYAEGLASYRAALAVDSRYAPALIGLGHALIKSGDPHAAIEPLSQVVNLSPSDSVALSLLGTALANSGRAAEAIETLRRALKIAEDPWTYCQLARALAREGRENEARDACARARRPHSGGNMSPPCDCR